MEVYLTSILYVKGKEAGDGRFRGYTFEVGKSYLIFAHTSNGNKLTTSLCSRNSEIEKAIEELMILGKGKSPKA